MVWLLNNCKYKKIHENIITWYQQYGRVTLPWRNTQNPYEIYLSEIMLQQTQVKTVLERFYFPFLKKSPTLQDVALAPVDDILKAWEGLGYYTRARNLHKTAQETKGILPNKAQELVKLSGIGPSTAHAVACFAFNEALPILDANVKRILYRFFVIKKRDEKLLWKKAYELFDKKIKKSKLIKNHFMIIYAHNNKYALLQNSTKLLNGLWGFPQETSFKQEINSTLLGEFTQHYTHFRLNATLLLIKKSQKKELH